MPVTSRKTQAFLIKIEVTQLKTRAMQKPAPRKGAYFLNPSLVRVSTMLYFLYFTF